MSVSSVTVQIDSSWVEHFRATKTSLCSAFGVKTGSLDPEYNVIATSEGTYLSLCLGPRT